MLSTLLAIPPIEASKQRWRALHNMHPRSTFHLISTIHLCHLCHASHMNGLKIPSPMFDHISSHMLWHVTLSTQQISDPHLHTQIPTTCTIGQTPVGTSGLTHSKSRDFAILLPLRFKGYPLYWWGIELHQILANREKLSSSLVRCVREDWLEKSFWFKPYLEIV